MNSKDYAKHIYSVVSDPVKGAEMCLKYYQETDNSKFFELAMGLLELIAEKAEREIPIKTIYTKWEREVESWYGR